MKIITLKGYFIYHKVGLNYCKKPRPLFSSTSFLLSLSSNDMGLVTIVNSGLNYLYKTKYEMVKIRSFSKHFLPVYIYWFSIIFVKFDFVVNNSKKYCFFQIVLFFNKFLFLVYSISIFIKISLRII